jgi:HD-GYP domain-containing protein (c-di-GMP phosphodiesterase class II)
MLCIPLGDVAMKTNLSLSADGGTVVGIAYRTLLRTITTVGQQAQPQTFAHVQPHAHATARLSRLFATACHPNSKSRPPTLDEIEYSAYLHDIGKYFIDPSVLLKPGSLDEEEKAVMRLHPSYGAIVISKLPGSTPTIRRVIFHHHEHWDGSGYPEGLFGTAIPLEARIVSIVDVYTSLRARRSYKPTLRKWAALATLTEMAGHELDPQLVEDFVKMVNQI